MTLGVKDLLVIIGLPLAVVILAFTFGVLRPRLRRARQRAQGITLAAFAEPGLAAPPRPARPPSPESVAAIHSDPAAKPTIDPQSPYAPPLAATGTLGAKRAEAATPVDAPRLRLETVSDRGTTIQSADTRPPTLRVHRPLDGTLQFLPGRLEVVEGRDIGQEFRFVRLPGVSQTEVTLGRQDGVPYRHFQLHEPTVSRLHAKLTLEERDWRLTNLSETNPASVNGTPLGAKEGSVILRDGDRVEMGEVVFVYRAK